MTMVTTPGGITLETLRRRERGAAAAALMAGAVLLALIGAGALCAACLRRCAPEAAPATAAACYEANWSRGVYGDELADAGGPD